MPETAPPERLPDVRRQILPEVRRRLPRITHRISEEIQAAVPSLAGGERRQQLVFTAVNSAAAYFLTDALGEDISRAAVDDLYRELGYRAAMAGGDSSVIDSAVRIASRACWDELRVAAANKGISVYALNDLQEALDAFVDHLLEQVQLGQTAGHDARKEDTGLARQRLYEAVLSGADREDLLAQAELAGWTVPSRIVVTTIDSADDPAVILDGLPDGVLARLQDRRATVLSDEATADAAIEAIQALLPRARCAVCWPVSLTEARTAYRWTQRALNLVGKGVIPARPVIDCATYRTEIWLHAEPTLRRHMAQDLLRSLFTETTNSREILSETLLVWLETRKSAPAIAARLGVHPQTVRYRWRRINELFGEDLHDPEFVTQLFLVLKATVPLWIAGDESDFEQFEAAQNSL